jgi:hypothetical protein
MKNYTDIEQSKRLAEILPPESADNVIVSIGDREGVKTVVMPKETFDTIRTPFSDIRKIIPCWSFSALLRLIPNFNMFKRTIECKIETTNHLIDKACDPIDAAFEMVCWLRENNKI